MKVKELKDILSNFNDNEDIGVKIRSITKYPSPTYEIKKVDTINLDGQYSHLIVI